MKFCHVKAYFKSKARLFHETSCKWLLVHPSNVTSFVRQTEQSHFGHNETMNGHYSYASPFSIDSCMNCVPVHISVGSSDLHSGSSL